MRHIVCLLAIVGLLGVSTTQAQHPCFGDGNLPLKAGPACSTLEVMLLDVIQIANNRSEPIRLVSRLGEGERKPAWHMRRLQNVRQYLAIVGGLESAVAHGPSVSGHGRVEISVGDRLVMVAFAERNKDLYTQCEYDGAGDPRYYPWKDKTTSAPASASAISGS